MEKHNSPLVSVIMGTYNCEDTLNEAVDSILDQTYKNWEFIICDDCSTDDTYEILLEYKKKYPDFFKVKRNEVNSKLSYSLNCCLEISSGQYVARMDADDISVSDRFEKQVEFLNGNTSIHLVGTAMRRFDRDKLADILYPIQKPDRFTLKNKIPFNHATIMTHKYVYDTLNGYTVSKRTVRAQDYDLWFRFYSKGYVGENILEPLYLVRENENSIKRRRFKGRFNSYKTTLIGFKLLNYPLHWYIKPTVMLFIKGLIPTKLMLVYRKYQASRFKGKSKFN